MNDLKVSIICGVYNADQYIEKCINSMLNQSYKDIEIILVVNASTDGSVDIVKKMQNKYSAIIHAYYVEDKLGAGGSRQFGFEHSVGDCICFVDCDDELAPDYVLNMVDVMKGSDADIVVCNFKKVDCSGNILYVRQYKNKFSALVQSVAPWGKMFRKEYLRKNEMTLRNIPFGEDILFATEIYMTKPNIELCDYIGYIWRDNPQSTSHTELRGFPQNTFEKSREYFEYICSKYSEKEKFGNEISYFIYKYYVWYLLQSGRKEKVSSMRDEYNKIFNYMKESNLNHKLVFGGGVKGERVIVRVVLLVIAVMEKLHLSKVFFIFYSQSFLGKFWPSL